MIDKLINKFKNFFRKNPFPSNKTLIIKKPRIICENTFHGYNTVDTNTSIRNSSIGFGSYISYGCDIKYAKIGKYCSVGPRVAIGFSTHPTSTWVTTHPAFYMDLGNFLGYTFHSDKIPLFNAYKFVKGEFLAEIGNDVWIGADVKIMDGITIGDGAIIAAGAVVTKNIEPYAIVGGVPAKCIKYRFSSDEIQFLMNFKWWDKPVDWIKEHIGNFSNIKEFIANNELQTKTVYGNQ